MIYNWQWVFHCFKR